MSNIQGALFMWREDDHARYGEGISRPVPKSRTKLYTLIVYKSGAMPMTMTMRAESKAAAITYAQNRWPNATVEAMR
jgi:hypothetical protein